MDTSHFRIVSLRLILPENNLFPISFLILLEGLNLRDQVRVMRALSAALAALVIKSTS
jgi:hypothetical protein